MGKIESVQVGGGVVVFHTSGNLGGLLGHKGL